MRLWHYQLIPYLPNSQLLAQWRELNSIFAKEDRHILINYIYNYDKRYLLNYTEQVVSEMNKRGIKAGPKSIERYLSYFNETKAIPRFEKGKLNFKEHDLIYLTICYYNLKEKYIRGQKDFTKDVWNRLVDFCNPFGFKENERSKD